PNATTTLSNGYHTVCLTISDSTSFCSSTYCDSLYIGGSPSPCNASFTFTLGANGQVNFSSNSTGVNSSTSYFWNFGNGNTATGPNATTTLSNGYHTVCLTISDSSSFCSSTYCDSLYIGGSPSPCNASFTFTLGANGQVNFSSNSTGVNSSTSYFWNFGNGNTAAGPNATTTLSNGYHTVCLTISDSSSFCSSTYCDSLYIGGVIPTALSKHAGETLQIVKLYPNPVKENTTLNFAETKPGQVTIAVLSITGSVLKTQVYNSHSGQNTVELATDALAPGLYFITLKTLDQTRTIRLIKE
ncbi:MAG: PKD domain-containing protein, partial [Sediminibacterium sp.]|nr:PKD domain-containing protein [Sediminibacterium sp.]